MGDYTEILRRAGKATADKAVALGLVEREDGPVGFSRGRIGEEDLMRGGQHAKPTLISLFTGAGGLDLGFEQAGFRTVFATDIDGHCCETLQLNLGSHLDSDAVVRRADILDFDLENLPVGVDLIIGGPPCQSFSASGRRAGGAAGRLDQRGKLFEAYCRIINHVQPKAFVFENVRGILGTNKGEDWKAIVDGFGALGYRLSHRLLDALDYGAPQQRERMFLVGHKLDGDFLFPRPTHGPDSPTGRPYVSVSEAFHAIDEIDDLTALRLQGGKYSNLLREVPPGQNYLYFTAKRGHPRPVFAYRSRFSDFLYKANPETPVKTIIASPGKYTGPLHWENRYFSIQEYKRLQGFPDDYIFSGDRSDVIRQIGNSVSPPIAFRLALAIRAQILGIPTDVPLLDAQSRLSFDRRKSAKAQTTRALHLAIQTAPKSDRAVAYFNPRPYTTRIEPSSTPSTADNVHAVRTRRGVDIRLHTGDSAPPFASMTLAIRQGADKSAPTLKLNVDAFGSSPGTVQAIWNTVDDWVRRSSDFHSLFELYGHFTEPHPMFEVERFLSYSDDPIARFAAHASDFKNCSRYFPKHHLIEMFADALGTRDFNDIADHLRSFRFDIRSHETNIAIARDIYMVAYPFNLPARRQMNFRVRRDRLEPLAQAS